MFDFDKQLSPSAVEKKQLLFQFSRHSLIARLNQKVSSIVHVHVLLNPVWKIPEKLLQKNSRCLYTTVFSFHSTAFHLKVSNISTHPFVTLWLVEHLLSVLQPGLQAGHCAAVFLPVADHFLQHAADAAHLHWQVLPLRCRIAQKLIHPFYLLSWRQITSWITESCILNIEHLIFELHNP